MCGRFTNKLTWEDIVRLYRLTLDAPPHNLRPRYNVCPTDTIDTVVVELVARFLALFFVRSATSTFCGFLAYRGTSLADFRFRRQSLLLAIAIPHVNLDVPAEE